MNKNLLVTCLVLFSTGLCAQSGHFFFQKLDCQLGSTLCFDPDSNLWIGAIRDNQPLLLNVTRDGILLDQLELAIAFGSRNIPTELLIDSDGMLVGCGTMSPAVPWENESSFVFRYDPVARQLLWSRRLFQSFFFANGVLEKSPGGPFLISGTEDGIPTQLNLLQLDRNTGEILPDFNFSYQFGLNERLSAALYHQGAYYAIGQNDLRSFNGSDPGPYLQQGLWRFDSSGTPVWSLNSYVPVSQRSLLRGRDLLIEDNAIISIGDGDAFAPGPAPSRAKVFLQKTSLDGTPVWIQKFDVLNYPLDAQRAYELISVADGFVIYGGVSGSSDQDFLLKTDKAGNLLWAQRIKTFGNANSLTNPQSDLITDGKALYIITNIREGSLTFGALVKTDLNGNIPGCDRLTPLVAKNLPINDPVFTGITLPQTVSEVISEATETEILPNTALASEKYCQNEDTPPQTFCDPTTFLRRPGAPDDQFRLTAITALPQGFICMAGQEGPAALLAALDVGGNFLWTKKLKPAPGDSLAITDMIVDSDSLLTGSGYYIDAQGQRSRYAFRFRPDSTATLLWSVRLPGSDAEGGSIVEIKSGDNFLLFHNLRIPGGQLVPETVRLNRTTGAVVPLSGRRYESGAGGQFFSSVAANPLGLFVQGQSESAGSPRMTLSRINANTGDLNWAQLGHNDPAAQAISGGYGSVIEDGQGNLLLAYTGATSGDPAQPDRLFLQKTIGSGVIGWLRQFELPVLTDIGLMQVPDGFVLMGKTGVAEYVFLKTDKNGNLLLGKRLEFGAVPPGGNMPTQQSAHRMALLGGHLFFILHDGRAGQQGDYLLKTDLNLELAGPCAFMNDFSPMAKTVFSPVTTPFSGSVASATLSAEAVQPEMENRDVAYDQICPPVYVDPVLDLGPDRVICSLDTALLTPTEDFVTYLWQDGSTAAAFAASLPGVYILEATTLCKTVLRDTVQVSVEMHPSRADTLVVAPNFPVTLGNGVYFAPDTVTLRIPSGTGFCDTLHTYFLVPCQPVSTSLNLSFYPGEVLLLDGYTYDHPGVYTHTLQTQSGCDSVVTYQLEWLITNLDLTCSADRVDTAALGQSGHPVVYDLPVVDTDCPEPGTGYSLLTGLPPGASFPVGTTTVCYEGFNGCGIRDTCCFTVTVVPTTAPDDPPCDVKMAGNCLQVELLGIQLDSVGDRRYSIRLRNTCAAALDYVAIQLPKGLQALSPAEGAVYLAPSGNAYLVRNPNASPFYSIRYRALTDNLKNGVADILTYTLPAQAAPPYIHVFAKLANGISAETHLSALNCTPLPWAGVHDRSLANANPAVRPGIRLWPNPAGSSVQVDLSFWLHQRVQLRIVDAQGQVVFYSNDLDVSSGLLGLQLDGRFPDGLYHLSVQGPGGLPQAVRFVVIR